MNYNTESVGYDNHVNTKTGMESMIGKVFTPETGVVARLCLPMIVKAMCLPTCRIAVSLSQ